MAIEVANQGSVARGGEGNGPGGGSSGGRGGGQGGGQGRDWRHLRDMGIAVLAWLAVLGILFWGLSHVIGSLMLFIVAAILAYALAPAVTHLERFMPRPLAIALVYLGILTTLSGLIYLIVITAIGQVSMLLKDVQSLLATGPNGQESPLVGIFKSVGLTDQQIQSAGQRMLAQVQGLTGDAVSIAAGVVDALVRTVLIGVLSIYLLKDGPKVVNWLRNNTPIVQRPRIVYFVDTLDTVVGGYIRGQLTLSALIGVLVGGGMWLFHVPYAVFLGVLAFVLEFIPIVGVFISGGICVVLALTQGVGVAIVVLIYFAGVHFIEGDVVGPRIMSKAVGLHPAISILALFAGAELFGIWGALFAAPVAGLIQAVIRTFWLEWRASHPEQFPTGYTVTPDVRVIPVVHAEAPPPKTVEANVTPEPAEPLREQNPDENGDLTRDLNREHTATPTTTVEATRVGSAETLAELAEAPAQAPEQGRANGHGALLATASPLGVEAATPDGALTLAAGDPPSANGDPSSNGSHPAGPIAASPELPAEVDGLLPDVAARAREAPDLPTSSIYDRFGSLEPVSPAGGADPAATSPGGALPTTVDDPRTGDDDESRPPAEA